MITYFVYTQCVLITYFCNIFIVERATEDKKTDTRGGSVQFQTDEGVCTCMLTDVGIIIIIAHV